MLFSNLDIFIVAFYCVGIIALAQYVSRSQQGKEKTAEDYFLAGRSLPWWAIGASLIAANISAEQIIGMSGQGFVVGMAIATYELVDGDLLKEYLWDYGDVEEEVPYEFKATGVESNLV